MLSPAQKLIFLFAAASAVGCSSGSGARADAGGVPDSGDAGDTADAADADVGADGSGSGDGPWFIESVSVTVTLDGEPVEGALVMQGGTATHVFTDSNGRVTLEIDNELNGERVVIASHPEARILSDKLEGPTETEVSIALIRYDDSDNPAYPFQDPGEPRRRPTTAQCAHCHQTIGDAWWQSPHRTAASNPALQDLYAGVAGAFSGADTCEAAGGTWAAGVAPGTGEAQERCYIGDGVLAALNPECADGIACDARADLTAFGACADCHAPATTGPNGELGQRDLLEARDFAHDFGVFCDVCHRTDEVLLDSPDPGVSGRLRLTRPTEPSPSPTAGDWAPLTFGPSHDSPNPRMGSVQRDHYRSGLLCAGCHEHDQPVLVAGSSIDTDRWPSETLPIHSTYTEWTEGPLSPFTACNDCHMPPAPGVLNGGDLQRFPLSTVGIQGGWHRPAGAVRQHSWIGPRTDGSRMLELAAALFVEKRVLDGTLEVEVTTQNVGCGHRIPTGEPLRAMILLVEARCGDEVLPAVGGDVVPDFGGAVAVRDGSGDLGRWPEASPGDRVRVAARSGAWIDYEGFGPFGDGRFSAEEKGMPAMEYRGEREIVSISGEGVATFDAPLPAGDVAYLIASGEDADWLAGAPGFAFARVLVGADGARMVPHFAAIDVASDNRLAPQQAHVSTHRFAASCADPIVSARLLHRRWPPGLARERGWSLEDQVMTEVTR